MEHEDQKGDAAEDGGQDHGGLDRLHRGEVCGGRGKSTRLRTTDHLGPWGARRRPQSRGGGSQELTRLPLAQNEHMCSQ